ncbi:MAG: sigma-54-dependent Fis family transcriptional regulator [Sphingobacteriia bacterium]|nr:sigma-54-dependent Fis family transcriptional regulator [Sphingobacteriia bacterium]
MSTILVVDDEKDIREIVQDILEDEGFKVIVASDGLDAIKKFNENNISTVLLDIWLEGSEIDGLGVLENIQAENSDIPVIMISGHATIEVAVQSIKMGAYDFIEKPLSTDKLLNILRRAIETYNLKKENNELKKKIGLPQLVGKSPHITQIKAIINKLAQTSSRVLISGPSGCGKRLVAELIHQKSKRAKYPFIVFHPVNFVSERFQQEIVGNQKPGNDNVVSDKNSIFAKANNGTLYIDEVTDMSIEMQNLFLRQLQQPGYDVRVIASTSRNIEQLIKEGRFREDLYYRLNVMPIKIPSLIERKEDVPLLCEYFINYHAEISGVQKRELSEDAVAALQLFEWPGNVRQLKNIIEWLLIMVPGNYSEQITAEMLPNELISNKAAIQRPDNNVSLMSLPLREAREIFEKQYLTAQVLRFNGNISKTSSFIGMERSALHRKLKSLNIITDINNDNDEKIANNANNRIN